MKRHSTQTSLHRVIDDWLEQINDNSLIGACLLDVSKCSEFNEIYSGVPQGSVLGPLLFLLFINDVSNFTTDGCVLNMDADDVIIYTSAATSDDLQLKLQRYVDSIYHWYFRNK